MNAFDRHDSPDRILLVEDSPTQGARLKYDLEEKCFQVQWVRDGRKALAALGSFEPHAIVTDVLMPGMDGFDLCREIRTRQAFQNTPVIVVTALSEPDDIIRALEVGATHFLVKPFNLELLISHLQHLALNRRLESRPSADFAIQINFKGQIHTIRSDRFQILNLLFSTYENMVEKTRTLDLANQNLHRAKEELHAALAQKEALLQEIRHRVKGIFQMLSGLLGLEIARSADPGVAALLKTAQERLWTVARIHDKLYQTEDMSNIPIDIYLGELATTLLEAYSPAASRITLRTDLAIMKLDIEAAIPCALIASELIGNALKHGLAKRDTGELFLGLSTDGASVTLTVGDDGDGLPPDFQTGATDFLGLRLVELFARQLGGSLRISAEEGRGSQFSVSFPRKNAISVARSVPAETEPGPEEHSSLR